MNASIHLRNTAKRGKMEKKIKYNLVGPELKKQLLKVLKNIDENVNLLYEAAVRDPKTGLYNFLFFKNMLDIEGAKARRGADLSVGIFDLDFFKKINDNYGHLTGDKILIGVARILQKNLRKSDIVARFGGEEFIVLMPNTPVNRAFKVLDRLRRLIKEDKNMERYGVSASCGVTAFREKDNLGRFKARADKALYKAKSSGRNRVEIE